MASAVHGWCSDTDFCLTRVGSVKCHYLNLLLQRYSQNGRLNLAKSLWETFRKAAGTHPVNRLPPNSIACRLTRLLSSVGICPVNWFSLK